MHKIVCVARLCASKLCVFAMKHTQHNPDQTCNALANKMFSMCVLILAGYAIPIENMTFECGKSNNYL